MLLMLEGGSRETIKGSKSTVEETVNDGAKFNQEKGR